MTATKTEDNTSLLNTNVKRLDNIVRHISNVRDDCLVLGERLIEEGETELGRLLIANGFKHDNSKLSGIEWLYLHEDVRKSEPEKFILAMEQHITTNKHHPECAEWNGDINEMPRLYRAEFICDIHARASEFGTDIREWLKVKATKRWKMNHNGKTYKELKELLDLLLEKAFV